jgi:hypothetical protein
MLKYLNPDRALDLKVRGTLHQGRNTIVDESRQIGRRFLKKSMVTAYALLLPKDQGRRREQ